MFDCFVHPLVPVENKKVAGKVSRGPQPAWIRGVKFVPRKHQADHFIVRHIGVQGFDSPVAPVPDVLLTVAQLASQSPPVAVAPDIQPVPGPAFPVALVPILLN